VVKNVSLNCLRSLVKVSLPSGVVTIAERRETSEEERKRITWSCWGGWGGLGGGSGAEGRDEQKGFSQSGRCVLEEGSDKENGAREANSERGALL